MELDADLVGTCALDGSVAQGYKIMWIFTVALDRSFVPALSMHIKQSFSTHMVQSLAAAAHRTVSRLLLRGHVVRT